jgi:hypothetical protein
MTTYFGYVPPADLAGHLDPVRVLRLEPTEPELRAHPDYDPAGVQQWAAADVAPVDPAPVMITNQATANPTPALVCRLLQS